MSAVIQILLFTGFVFLLLKVYCHWKLEYNQRYSFIRKVLFGFYGFYFFFPILRSPKNRREERIIFFGNLCIYFFYTINLLALFSVVFE